MEKSEIKSIIKSVINQSVSVKEGVYEIADKIREEDYSFSKISVCEAAYSILIEETHFDFDHNVPNSRALNRIRTLIQAIDKFVDLIDSHKISGDTKLYSSRIDSCRLYRQRLENSFNHLIYMTSRNSGASYSGSTSGRSSSGSRSVHGNRTIQCPVCEGFGYRILPGKYGMERRPCPKCESTGMV